MTEPSHSSSIILYETNDFSEAVNKEEAYLSTISEKGLQCEGTIFICPKESLLFLLAIKVYGRD